MADELNRIFDANHALDRASLEGLGDEQHSRLRSMARGEVASPNRARAIDALVAARAADARATLEAVVADPDDDASFRAAAASQLGRLGDAGAADALLSALDADNPFIVRVSSAGALGKLGTPAQLEELSRIGFEAKPELAPIVRFSASLIAYRNGIDGQELPVPARRNLLAPDRTQAVPIALEPAPVDDARAAIASATLDSYGLALTPGRAQYLRCRDDTMMILFGESDGAPLDGAALDEPRLLAVVAVRAPSDGSWSVRWLLLSWPQRDGTYHLAVHRTDGRQAFYGTAGAADDSLTFELAAVAGRGALPITITGVARGTDLSFVEAIASRTTVGQSPAPLQPLR